VRRKSFYVSLTLTFDPSPTVWLTDNKYLPE